MDEKPKRRRGRPTKAEAEQIKKEREEAASNRIKEATAAAKLYKKQNEELLAALEAKKRGPAPLYTPEKLQAACEKYIVEHISNNEFPDEAGMRVELGLSKSTWEKYQADEAYKEVFEYCMDCRQSFLERRMVSEPKLAQGCLNSLKQKQNGGYVDRFDNGNGASATLRLVFPEPKEGMVQVEASDFK